MTLMMENTSLMFRDGQQIFRVRLFDEIVGGYILTLIGEAMSLALTLPSVQQFVKSVEFLEIGQAQVH